MSRVLTYIGAVRSCQGLGGGRYTAVAIPGIYTTLGRFIRTVYTLVWVQNCSYISAQIGVILLVVFVAVAQPPADDDLEHLEYNLPLRDGV